MSMTTPTLLLVDDIPLNLLLLHEFLTDTTHPCHVPYSLVSACDGLEAITLLEAEPTRFSVVLMDIMMPRMDGLEVLERMQAHPLLMDVPVIFQTAKISSEDFAVGIQAGAYYYLTKPVDQNHLLAIVQSALAKSDAKNTLKDQLKKPLYGLPLIQSVRLACRTLDDAHHAASLLGMIFPDAERVGPGILELLCNAVEHGNLGLSYDDKTIFSAENRWEEEVQRRLELPENAQKQAIVELERTLTQTRLIITDQGKGFDWRPYMYFDSARMTHTHGRGIAMANSVYFDSLQYQGCGNQVIAIVNNTIE
ncbi:MAG: response regulator [Magnetococcus sp. YQC-5]